MSRTKQGPAAQRFRRRLQGSEVSWVIAFLIPYGAVFLTFAVYPIAYGIWMGREPRRFVHITFPLLANIYLVCTLLSTIWMLGDYSSVHFVSGGAPALSTDVLATLGIRYAFDYAQPQLGVAAMLSALPVLIPIVILLLRKVQTTEVQL